MSDVPRDSCVLRRHLLWVQLDHALHKFTLVAASLGDHAKLIALPEGEPAAPKGQCDRHRAGPSQRELAAKVALDRRAAFRPPFLGEEATAQSCAILMEGSE